MPPLLAPPPSAEETWKGKDGLALHVERFEPEGPVRAVAVHVHGFAAYAALYRNLGHALAAAGVETAIFDCRGHGSSAGRRGHVGRFADYVDDLDAALAQMRARRPGVPAAVTGHSQGGAVVLDWALGGGRADALVVAAPWLSTRVPVPGWKLALSGLAETVWPTLAMDNELRGPHVSRTPEVVDNFDHDPHVVHVGTPRWFNEVRRAQARILDRASALRLPTFMPVAGDDRIVRSDVALAFAATANAGKTPPPVEVKVYPGLFHEMLLEPERDQVIRGIVAWLQHHLGPERG